MQDTTPSRGQPLGGAHRIDLPLRVVSEARLLCLAFAFDPERKAVILVAGDKSGTNEKKFYKKLINTADKRYKAHLRELKKKEKE